MTSAPAPAVAMRGIVKRYGATTALDGVDLCVEEGEVHALLGENGAGKSTLMRVLSGSTRADAGSIERSGRTVAIAGPGAARTLGIAMVHQHFTLVPAFTVAENLALDADKTPGGYRPVRAAEPALERAKRVGWELDPGARLSSLPVGLQQRVEIAKALATDPRVLILDEPTAVLTPDEADQLFEVLRALRAAGVAVLLIAHKLSEVMAVADTVTVLRRGQLAGRLKARDTSAAQLAELMVGAPQPISEGRPGASEQHAGLSITGLHVSGLRGERAVRGLNLEAPAGCITGIGGVDGNGQTELAEALGGLRPAESGTVMWQGHPVTRASRPTTGYIPPDRSNGGLALTMSVAENLLFHAAGRREYSIGPFLRAGKLRRLANEMAERFDIRTPSVDLPASSLSGGNQQKIVIARALFGDPELIVAVSPTRGLDVGAAAFVHSRLLEARRRGAAVVLISTDLDEVLALSDTAYVLSSGALSPVDSRSATGADIGLLLGGAGAHQ